MSDTSAAAVLAAIKRLQAKYKDKPWRASGRDLLNTLSALEALVKEREAAATDLVGDKFLRAAQSSDARLADFVVAVGK